MSWLKFWKSSSKKNDKKSRSELVRSESFKDDTTVSETEKEKNARLRHTMSISRSGRFKQKNKQRAAILDKPEFFTDSTETAQKENLESSNSQSNRPTNNYSHEYRRTPPSTCREVSSRQPINARHFEGQQTVL